MRMLVSHTHHVHRISPHVRDDREPPLIRRETRGVKSLICPTTEAECFSRAGWTRQITLKSLAKFSSSFRGDAQHRARNPFPHLRLRREGFYDVRLHIIARATRGLE
ncbi:hypothetical protein I6F35_04765 [Bradyrhizobium sp. BRP22]|uniref:hypothetical protein n=1 Tax=Bradyrhizobium sp. BRP22 TaxID=2793821 RepID=UPI001CD6A219|nr:hypothetical protein [Bradyrhizobium sp. BRP22]MCA1452530.1 hypothetical protein [Bradyrhizobium sp. BRP22]